MQAKVPEKASTIAGGEASPLTITGEVDPAYRKLLLVPSFVRSSRADWLFKILGAVGGAVLGVGLAPLAAAPRLPDEAVKVLATKCVEDMAACGVLDVRVPWNSQLGWLLLGLTLVVLTAIAERRASSQ